jgi:molybdenum cofactor cytidylyltransferase
LGDQPFITANAIDQVLDRFSATHAPVVRPLVNGEESHPVLIAAGLFSEIRETEGDIGACEVVRRHRDRLELVPVDHAQSSRDIDTPEDYKAIGNAL